MMLKKIIIEMNFKIHYKYMILYIITICVLIFAMQYPVFAEPKEYKYWGDDYFENDTLKLPDSISQKPALETSTGFFPKPLSDWNINLVALNPWDNHWNTSNGIDISHEFPVTKHIFQTTPPIDKDDFEDKTENKKPFSDENEHGWIHNLFSNDGYRYYGVSFDYTIPKLHTKFSLQTGYCNEPVYLYSPLVTKYFLNYAGEKQSFQECSVIEIWDQSIKTSINLKHPVYGAFMKESASNTSYFTYYYIAYGIGCDIVLDSKVSRYNYILSPNDYFRYIDGKIKEDAFYEEAYHGYEKYRFNYNIGIGWIMSINGTANGGATSFEVGYTGSINSLLKNQELKRRGLYTSISLSVTTLISIIKGLGYILGITW